MRVSYKIALRGSMPGKIYISHQWGFGPIPTLKGKRYVTLLWCFKFFEMFMYWHIHVTEALAESTTRIDICLKFSLSVREITKNGSTFSTTNTSSNIVWSISTAWYNPNGIKWNLILVPNWVAFISQKEKNVFFLDYHSLTCSVRKMVLICLMQNIDIYLLYKSHQIARLVSHLINHFSK